MKKSITLTLAILLVISLLTACGGGGGLPDGTYTPVAVTMTGLGRTEIGDNMDAYGGYSIVIEGDKFTTKVSGVSSTVKYSYKDGSLTFLETADASISFDITYKDDTLFWNLAGMTIEMKKQ